LPPPVHTLEEGEIEMGDTGPVGNFPNGGVMSASCEMINQGEVHLNNSGNLDWPQGTYFEVTLSNGMVFTVTTGGFSPEGDMMIPPEYLFPPDGIPDLGESLPLDFMCDIKMVLPNDMGQTP
jgi:hypothetical protein